MKKKSLIKKDFSVVDEYKEFDEVNDNWCIESYVNLKYDLNSAIAFGNFFFPNFVEIDDCIIIESRFNKEIYYEWRKTFDNNNSQTEKMCNLYEIKDFFHINDQKKTEKQIEYFGVLLANIFEINLKNLFPQKLFKVELFTENNDKYLTFYQVNK